MGGGSWKVAYADFMTAMMAFFLLMWLLNVLDEEQLKGLASWFTPDAASLTQSTSPVNANNPILQQVEKLDLSKVQEIEESYIAIARALKKFLMQDAIPSASSGVASDPVGVLLHLTSDLMFKPGTLEFTEQGMRALDEVVVVMNKHKVYLLVRGHADSSESGGSFPSLWELSSARANAAVRYLIQRGIDPKMLRSVAYSDIIPRVPPTIPDAAQQNSRVEFFFHRPEVMSTTVAY